MYKNKKLYGVLGATKKLHVHLRVSFNRIYRNPLNKLELRYLKITLGIIFVSQVTFNGALFAN